MPPGCTLDPAGASANAIVTTPRATTMLRICLVFMRSTSQSALKRSSNAAHARRGSAPGDRKTSRPGCQKPGRLADRDAQPRAQSGDMSNVPRLNIRTPEPLTFATNSLR